MRCFLSISLFVAYATYTSGVAIHGRGGADETLPSCDFNASQVDRLNDAVKAALQKRNFLVREGEFHAVQSSAFWRQPWEILTLRIFRRVSSKRMFPYSNCRLLLRCCFLDVPRRRQSISHGGHTHSPQKVIWYSLRSVIRLTIWLLTPLVAQVGDLLAVATTADYGTLSSIQEAVEEAGAPKGIVNLMRFHQTLST